MSCLAIIIIIAEFYTVSSYYNFGREEIFNIQMVATANNRRTFNIIYL